MVAAVNFWLDRNVIVAVINLKFNIYCYEEISL